MCANGTAAPPTPREHRASRQSIKRRGPLSRIGAVPESSQDGRPVHWHRRRPFTSAPCWGTRVSWGVNLIPVRDTIPHRRTPVVTWALIAVNVLVFLYELSLGPEELEGLLYLFGIVPARYTHPEWALQIGLPIDDYWPFLTSMFLHGGWAH